MRRPCPFLFASVSHTVACVRTNKSDYLSENVVFRLSAVGYDSTIIADRFFTNIISLSKMYQSFSIKIVHVFD